MLAHFAARSLARLLAHTSIGFVYFVSSCIYIYVSIHRFTFIYLKIDVCLFGRMLVAFYSFHLTFALFRFPFDCLVRSDCVFLFIYLFSVRS